MKKSHLLAFSLVLGGLSTLGTHSAQAFFFGTFDGPVFASNIEQGMSQVQEGMNVVQNTVSVTNIQQSMGDAVGPITQMKDNVLKKAEKKQEKMEKQKQNAERFKKLKKDIEDAKKKYDQMKNAAEQAKDKATEMYEQGKEMYDQGMEAYNEGMEYYETAQDMAGTLENLDMNSALDVAGSSLGRQDLTNAAKGVVSKSNSAKDTLDDEYLLDDEDYMSADWSARMNQGDFNEGEWDGLLIDEEGLINEDGAVANTMMPGGRERFKKAVEGEDGLKTMPQQAINPKVVDAVSEAPVAIAPNNVSTAVQATPKALNNKATLKTIAAPVQNEKLPVAKGAVENQTLNKSENLRQFRTLPAATMPAATENKGKAVEETGGLVKRQTFKKVSFRMDMPMAFAQVGGDVKTGTTEDGKFIFPDKIAEKCGLNYDGVNETAVAACVKTWVMATHDSNATEATAARNDYLQAMGEQVSNALGTSWVNKAYSATFDTAVADDLEGKMGTMTSERDILGMFAEISRANQEILIRLMDSYASQIMTETMSIISNMDVSYYEGE